MENVFFLVWLRKNDCCKEEVEKDDFYLADEFWYSCLHTFQLMILWVISVMPNESSARHFYCAKADIYLTIRFNGHGYYYNNSMADRKE